MQLKLAGKLNDVRGIVFGEMLDCRQSPDQDYTLEEVVLRVVGDLRSTGGVWLAFRTCVAREHHAAHRGEGPARSGCTSEAEDSGIGDGKISNL